MGKCTYCGQPAGFFHSRHPECETRHQSAVAKIPLFFEKVMNNPIPAERFTELLRAGAEGAHLKPDELKAMCVAGINNIINMILRGRPLNNSEVQRITELANSLGTLFPDGLELDEKLIKMSIVSDLFEGKVPANIVIVGPIPIEFAHGEVVLWVFNQVRSYHTEAEVTRNAQWGPASPMDTTYFSPQNVIKSPVSASQLSDEETGDMVLTNRNIYFFKSEDAHLRLPIARVTSVQPCSEGVYVACKSEQEISRTFLLNDAWFAANAVVRLTQLAYQ